MSNVTKLPTAATSYVTVNKRGDWWEVVLATPCPGRALKTRLCGFSDRAMAFDYGRRTAERIKRPFKAKEGAT